MVKFSESVRSYLETQLQETVNDAVSDPLIGLFAATPDLAINSERCANAIALPINILNSDHSQLPQF
ncbi:hypothetical protein [Anabaena sp. WFMT]|uniref:hypothetical protein n=1 Tax=Anabaena sp. WFMT TaxID=3449730 RepID=UPI003F69FA3B